MAAKFESGQSTEMSPTSPRSASKTQALISQFSQDSSLKNEQSTKSVSTTGQRSKRHDSVQDAVHSRNPSAAVNTVGNEISEQDLRVSVGEEAAIRAVELQQTEKERKPSKSYREQPEILTLRKTVPRRKPVPTETGAEVSLKDPGSLGTMIPHPEQPPIAQHLNLMRPPSSTSNAQQGVDTLQVPHSTPTPIQRPGSTSTLHKQIRNLQRQLNLKTEEAVQLRRQLEVQEDTDVGTLSQQLREAKREAQMWKERAESAERRIKVFERFTARLKGLRVAGETAKGQDTGKMVPSPELFEDGEKDQNEDTLRNAAEYESDSSGRTEDAGIVSARIQTCLDGLTDDPPDNFSLGLNQTQNTTLSEMPKRDISPRDVEVWMAAQELLDLNEAQRQIDGGGSTS
ncbi:hypothetical protein ACLX1H_003262 [Fusarium chlamydosporum]